VGTEKVAIGSANAVPLVAAAGLGGDVAAGAASVDGELVPP
jgi:hypothetical protein